MSVSVIIPTYNRLPLLIETLDNILNQSLKPTEIIVVDNNSSDGTQDYLKHNYKGNVTLLNNKKNTPGAARNLGLKIASGKFIKFMDSDDLITTNTFLVQQKILSESDTGVVYSPYVHFSKENKVYKQLDVILQYNPIPQNKSLHKCMVKGFFTIIPGFMFTKEFVQEIGPWREDITAYEDWDYLWRIGNICPNPSHTNECCYFYRVHGQQTTGNFYNNVQRDSQKIDIFRGLYENYIKKDNNLFVVDKLFFLTQIPISLKNKKIREINNENKQHFSNFIIKLAKIFLRMESKLNRLLTNSDWQITHAICKDPQQFKHFLNWL